MLLVGHLEAAKLSTFLTDFFHPDRRTDVNQAAFYHVCVYGCMDVLFDVNGRWSREI